MKKSVFEPSRELRVSGEYDVVVVGGGIAGACAAVAAARNGVSVCLLERGFEIGGLATTGNVIVYLPLCDGRGNQVVGGLGEETLKLSVADGNCEIPAGWLPGGTAEERLKTRYHTRYNADSYTLLLEDFVRSAGVRILYDTRFCNVALEGNRISAVIVENKSGRNAIGCKYVVDCSGDADVCYMAGEDTVSLNTNVSSCWFYFKNAENKVELRPASRHFNADPKDVSEKSGRTFRGDDAEDVSDMMLANHDLVREELAKLRADRGTDSIFPVKMAGIPSYRMTRRLRGAFELDMSDEFTWFDDTIGIISNWRKAGPIYYLPFRSIAAVKTANLLAAGRCMSVGDSAAWDQTRVIPPCAVTGEAAGTAAALAVRLDNPVISEVPIDRLQQQLADQGVILDRRFATR